ncbi:MAG TPA: carboxypeptidase-like regulatory domain-containing protein [Thermoanaerobaculia bacterium]
MTNLRRLLSVALIATCITAVQSEAAKRRSVKHPSAPNVITAEITGTVVDDATGLPVVNATVVAGEESDVTDNQGKFTLKNVTGVGSVDLVVTRTGYTEKHVAITTSGKQTITVRVVSRSVVTVKKVDGTTFQLDDNSLEFGFSDLFTYRSSTDEDFCRPDGTQIVVKREEISRIVGPATLVPSAACCPGNTVQKVTVTLKAGGTTDLYFSDSCVYTRSVDLVGRNHVTGKVIYTPFSQIAEVVFP